MKLNNSISLCRLPFTQRTFFCGSALLLCILAVHVFHPCVSHCWDSLHSLYFGLRVGGRLGCVHFCTVAYKAAVDVQDETLCGHIFSLLSDVQVCVY